MRICRTLLIYCVSFAALIIAGTVVNLACGPETDPYDYYTSFFHSNIQGGNDYKPFRFTSYQFVYDSSEPASEWAINSAEWSNYLGKDVLAADVFKAMYSLNNRTDSALLKSYFKNGERLPDSLAKNTFLRAIQLKRNVGVFNYFRFVKNLEKIANLGQDKWNPQPLDSLALNAAGGTAWKTALAEKDKFLQLRYFYQAQRLLHYGRNYREALGIYNKYIEPNTSQSHVKGWALALKAGELRRLKDPVQSAYLFAKVFAQYPERRIQAYQNYKYLKVKTTAVLALTTNNGERAVIWAIDGFGNMEPALQPLEKVYQYDAASPMVGVLLVREIAKLEENYLTRYLQQNNTITNNAYTNYYLTDRDTLQPFRLAHIDKVNAFCLRLVNERKYPDYNVGYLAGAYLSWMRGDNAGGFVWLRGLNNEQLNPAMNDQKQIIQLLLSAQNIQKLNDINEAQLLPTLKWLDGKVKSEVKKVKSDYVFYENQQFTNTARNFYQEVLAPAYLKQGDTTKAALALLKSGANTGFWETNLHPTQTARIIRWKKTPSTVPYVAFLSDKLSTIKLNYLQELLGTAYLREHQYAKAIAAFKLVDPVTLNKFPSDYEKSDPFIDRINDYPKIKRYGKTPGFNKLQFAQTMNELEQKIKTDEKNAPTYYYRYATGLYNTSHYGNAWYLISYEWESSDFGRAELYSYDNDYVKTRNAEKYYLLARSVSNNEEFKAKCTFMAAKCEQKQVVAPSHLLPDYQILQKEYLLGLKSNKYFGELKANYKKTAFFKKSVGDCSYLKDFILSNN